jgi:hypothetical protein
MTINLTSDEIGTLLACLDFSRERLRNPAGAPANPRQENISELDAIVSKLQNSLKSADAAR